MWRVLQQSEEWAIAARFPANRVLSPTFFIFARLALCSAAAPLAEADRQGREQGVGRRARTNKERKGEQEEN